MMRLAASQHDADKSCNTTMPAVERHVASPPGRADERRLPPFRRYGRRREKDITFITFGAFFTRQHRYFATCARFRQARRHRQGGACDITTCAAGHAARRRFAAAFRHATGRRCSMRAAAAADITKRIVPPLSAGSLQLHIRCVFSVLTLITGLRQAIIDAMGDDHFLLRPAGCATSRATSSLARHEMAAHFTAAERQRPGLRSRQHIRRLRRAMPSTGINNNMRLMLETPHDGGELFGADAE